METFGFSEEGTDYDKPCTRAEAAEIAMRICGANVGGPKNFAAAFGDVTSENRYYPYIVSACDMGVMSVDKDVNFRPDDYISVAQASKAFIVITGYVIIPAFPQNFAKRLGILDGVTVGDRLTVGQVYTMAYNTLHIPYVSVTYGSTMEYEGSDKSVLELYHNISYREGVVTENEYTSLQKKFDDKTEGNLKVGYETYRYSANDCLGMHVRYYYDNYNKKIVYCAPDDENEVLTIDSADVTEYDGNRIEFEEDGKKRKETVPKDIDIIYNGAAYPLCTKDEFVPQIGSVSLIDNNTDGKYDVAVITSYRSVVVKGTNASTQSIYDKFGAKAVSVGEDGYLEVIADGSRGSIGNVEKDSVVLAAESYGGSFKYAKVLVLTDAAKGKITMISDDSYFLGEREVAMYDGYVCDSEPKVGDGVSIYLFNRKGVAIVENGESELIFSYIVDAAKKGAIDQSLSVKCITDTGDSQIFEFAPNVRINGTVYSNVDEIMTMLGNSAALSKTSSGYPYAQPILYRADGDGRITTLRILTDSLPPSDENLVTDGSADVVYHNCNYTFYDGNGKLVCSLDSRTPVLYVPIVERDDYAAYELNTLSSLEDRADYVIEPISLNDEKIPEYLLVYRDYKASVNTWDMPCIVTNKLRMLSSDGVAADAVALIDDGVEKKFAIADECVVPEFEVGDMVAYKVNAKSKIIALEKRLDIHNIPSADARASYTKIDGGYSEIEAQSRTSIGTVYNIGETIIAHVNNFPEEGMTDLIGYNHYLIGGRTKYFSFDTARKKVTAESIDSLVAYADDSQNATKAVMVTKYGELRCVYIIK